MDQIQFEGALGVMLGLMDEAKTHLMYAIRSKGGIREAMVQIYWVQYKLAEVLLKTTSLTIAQ